MSAGNSDHGGHDGRRRDGRESGTDVRGNHGGDRAKSGKTHRFRPKMSKENDGNETQASSTGEKHVGKGVRKSEPIY